MKQALFEASLGTCRALPLPPGSISGGRFAWLITEGADSKEDGFLAGDIEELGLKVAKRWGDGQAHLSVVGGPGIADLPLSERLSLYAWPDATLVGEIASQTTDPDKLQLTFPTFSGNALFWNATNGLANKIRAWTVDGGTTDFVDYLDGGVQHGAFDIATDGTNLFWLEGFGIATPGPYDAAAYYTAPFTSIGQPTGQRLTAASTGYPGSTSKVGCGMGAHVQPRSLQVVRLADGVSWTLGWSSSWSWQSPIALTCTELFATVTDGPITTVARVQLNSLGAGTPPK